MEGLGSSYSPSPLTSSNIAIVCWRGLWTCAYWMDKILQTELSYMAPVSITPIICMMTGYMHDDSHRKLTLFPNNRVFPLLMKMKTNKPITYSFAVIQSGVWNRVLRDPSLIVLPICVLEPCIRFQMVM